MFNILSTSSIWFEIALWYESTEVTTMLIVSDFFKINDSNSCISFSKLLNVSFNSTCPDSLPINILNIWKKKKKIYST